MFSLPRDEENMGSNLKTVQEIANKIQWEGGILDAVEYGIHATDIEDEDLAELWSELEFEYESVKEIVDNIDLYIESYLEAEAEKQEGKANAKGSPA